MRAATWIAVPTLALIVLLAGANMAKASPAYDAAIDLTFPVAGESSFIDDYDHCRGSGCSRRHRATDIMAPYGAAVHAAMGGVITFITGMDGNPPSYGYMISIAGDDGRQYNYIHLGRQDLGPNEAYAPGMDTGVRVERGQHIGTNGCSGNASCSLPHLHFEIVDPQVTDPYGSSRMNPYASLLAARDRGDVPSNAHRSWPEPQCGATPYALSGDWNGDGRHSFAWFCGGRWRLWSPGGSVHEFAYGRTGDLPLVGDWNGNGRDTVGVVRDGRWHLKNSLSSGASDISFSYGRVNHGDVPIVGDWNGNRRDTPGIIRDGQWHLRNSHSGGPGEIVFGYGRLRHGDLPLIGDWNRNGRDTIGIVRNGEWHLRNSLSGGPGEIVFTYGRVRHGDTPLTGDWNGDGRHTPAIVRDDEWHLRAVNRGGPADQVVHYPHH